MTSGAPQLPLAEFREVDDYGSTHELPAIIRGSDGGKKMYGPGDSLADVYTQHFRTELYCDRVVYPLPRTRFCPDSPIRPRRSRCRESWEGRMDRGDQDGSARSGAPDGRPEGGREVRWSARREQEVVLRLLRGESLDALARETAQAAGAISAWREALAPSTAVEHRAHVLEVLVERAFELGEAPGAWIEVVDVQSTLAAYDGIAVRQPGKSELVGGYASSTLIASRYLTRGIWPARRPGRLLIGFVGHPA